MNIFKNFIFRFIALALPTIIFIGCSTNKENKHFKATPINKTELFMGTAIKISLYDSNDEAILDEAFNKIKEIENLVSINKTNTELNKVNESAGKESVKISDITFDIIKTGLKYCNLSDGSFDITIGPLVKLWSIGLPNARIPNKQEINSTLSLINYKNVELNEHNKTIFLKNPNMAIDLGAIAKGYAADEVANLLKEKGIQSAIIDLGGNIYALGSKPTGEYWKIGIQNPFNNRGEIVGTISECNKSIVTSGIYERFIEDDGVKYHHILNPKTGYPYENELAGITIVSDKSVDGDALSTTIFSKGLKEGLSLVEKLNNTEAIFITIDKEIYLSSGLKDKFNISNSEFKLTN
ncbi:MAG: FAD:protein FMN transferase [Sarcina sp.]